MNGNLESDCTVDCHCQVCVSIFSFHYICNTDEQICVVLVGCDVNICDFHREQAWERWTSASKNGVISVRDEVLARLRRLARAMNEQTFQEALDDLKDSAVWTKNQTLRQWFGRTWLPAKEVSERAN